MATYNSFKRIATDSFVPGAVTAAKIATDAVTTAKINNNAIATTDIADGSVGTSQLASSLDLSAKTVTYRPIINSDISNTANIGSAKIASGAAVSNIGFTPLNKGGDTVGTSITLPAGSATSPSIRSSSATGTGIYFPASGEIAITTNSGQKVRFDTSGRPINPNQPAFYASGTGGWYYHNSFPSTASPGGQWREIINAFTWNVQQQGGSNMASNGRFTAPVAGYYYFYAQTYMYNDTNNSSGYTHFNIGRNRNSYSLWTGRLPHTIYGHGVPSHYVPGIMASQTMYMNAGDYASICPYMAPVCRFHGNHSLFCGYLIG